MSFPEQSFPEPEIEPSPETPVEDYVEQQEPAVDSQDAQGDEEAVVETPSVPRVPVEADEVDVVEQFLEVPLDDDYSDPGP